MSSWSAYPPRSRSRSPRSSRPPYGDSAQDSYRGDYDDGYERERGWGGGYERERDRAGYDYSRRGRSRSPPPPPDETGRKRRRSMSPYDRDRYDPRPRYSDGYEPRAAYSPPRRGGHAPASALLPSRRAPPDPHRFDYPASLKQFAEWFRYYYPQQAIEEDNADKAAEQDAGDGSKPRNGIKSKWEKYKKDFFAVQLQTMFEHHRRSPWFAEKYDPAPEFKNLRMRVRKEGWKGRLDTFLLDLESGKYDPHLNDSESESVSSPTKEHSGVNGENASTAETNGAVAAAASAAAGGEESKAAGGEDDMQFNPEADDEPADNDTSRADVNGRGGGGTTDKRGSGGGSASAANRGEEVSVPPEGNQVMIRTIPPDIGRVKLEEACGKISGFIYLALGDPLQKRNYYRAGWLRFKDDADMTAVLAELSEKKIEGFKLHVTHNQRPFVNKIRYTPEVANKPTRIRKDLESIKTLAGVLEGQARELRRFKPRAAARALAAVKAAEEQAAAAANAAKLQGEDSVMAPPESAAAAAAAAAVQSANNGADVASGGEQEGEEEEEELEPKESGSEAVEARIEKVMSDMKELGLVDVNDEKAYEDKKAVVSLDMYIAYLRAAFNTCYYCAVVTDHLEELQRKCLKHARKPLSKKGATTGDETKEGSDEKKVEDAMEDVDGASAPAPNEKEKEKEKERDGRREKQGDWKRNDDRWLEWLDSKLALLINRDGVDPRTYGGEVYDEELSKVVEPFIKQEDEGRYRCKTCTKLFKATSFIEKHIANKHPELVKILEDVPYFNNFVLDPHHIQPFTHPPPLVGNASQAPPPQAYGIQAPIFHAGEYGRGGPPAAYYGGGAGYPTPQPPPGYPAPAFYHGGNYWDHHAFNGGVGGPVPAPLGATIPGGFMPSMISGGGRRDEAMTARRLSERISGFAGGNDGGGSSLPTAVGLPPKPTAAALDSALTSGGNERSGKRGRNGSTQSGGPPPPPPPDAKEDPRAAAGKRVSYHDMDLVAEGDVELNY